jgi:ATP adenylyltransferase/5',5'''-P-1,P-4-tetraphosphate phosphorylase II
MELSKEARKLIKSQIKGWELASANYKSLEEVKTRKISFKGFDIDIQFNPKRLISSAAKIDVKSLEQRPCFLCQKNRPIQQVGLHFKDNYLILVNPFPIFPEHLTIPHIKHIDQQINGYFCDILDLAKALSDFVVFYNGPKSGASAPDHLHFQAIKKGFLPIENDFYNKDIFEFLVQVHDVNVYRANNYLRAVLTLKSNNKSQLDFLFNDFYEICSKLGPGAEEPMLNIIVLYDFEGWTVHVFPRKLHRPVQYYEIGEKQILLSPGCVDLGGTLILAREKDFIKINSEDVKDILNQVCSNPDIIDDFIRGLVSKS